MAKLTGPLMSLDARGKLGDVLVFMGWKGLKTVRQWLKPSNPKSADQGDIRVAIGGTGRAVGKIEIDSPIHSQLKTLDLIPDQQSKQSYLVQYIKDNYFAGTGTAFTTAYAAMITELQAHTAYTDWQSGADDLLITEFDLSYASVDPYEKALGLYLLAKAAIDLGFTGAPYTTALASWTATEIDAFVVEFAAV